MKTTCVRCLVGKQKCTWATGSGRAGGGSKAYQGLELQVEWAQVSGNPRSKPHQDLEPKLEQVQAIGIPRGKLLEL